HIICSSLLFFANNSHPFSLSDKNMMGALCLCLQPCYSCLWFSLLMKWRRWRQEFASRQATGSKDCVLEAVTVLQFATLRASLMANAKAYAAVAFANGAVKTSIYLYLYLYLSISNNV
ncbi:hypothetical protein AABB24_021029, partial [Solanum stoloniferum]